MTPYLDVRKTMQNEKNYRRSFLCGQDDDDDNRVEKIANLCFVVGRKAKVKDSVTVGTLGSLLVLDVVYFWRETPWRHKKRLSTLGAKF